MVDYFKFVGLSGAVESCDESDEDAELVDIADYKQLQSERNELAATVEMLRKIFPLKALVGCDANLNYPVSQYNDMVEAFNASPQQHLRDVLHERDVLLAQLASFSKHDSPLQHDLVVECERAMKQRDEYLRTKISTAGHGGSHDTCFTAILRNHIKLNEQHLRDVRAEAGRAGWVACVDWLVENSSADLFTDGEAEQAREIADQYAERVKAGE